MHGNQILKSGGERCELRTEQWTYYTRELHPDPRIAVLRQSHKGSDNNDGSSEIRHALIKLLLRVQAYR